MADDAATQANKILIHAARTDNLDLLNSVLHAEPPVAYDINYADGVGNTPLHYACQMISTSVLDPILEEEVDVDAQNRLDGNAPLHVACQVEHEEARNWLVQALLEAGASPATRNHAGLRPADLVVGDKATSPLGQALLQMLTMSQAEANLDADDIAFDDADVADDDAPSDQEA
ncbi:hypothetical protein MNAN1_001188 [Malassezia nana]|uniref:Ankyrin n=1 Tax=Malassezia nana TaxID=180528 RepID=A0AAF0J1M5_9BASI|nr:hypothetical protein MNAN1_001188 [Malassezia nana]